LSGTLVTECRIDYVAQRALNWNDLSPRPLSHMISKADTCRRKARECVQMAQGATDADVRLMYLDIARRWRELARSFDTPSYTAAAE
jgi:hypothetical protein